MTDVVPGIALTQAPSTGQRLFLRYFTAILVDLVVLNLLAEYWETVVLDSFTISLFAAVGPNNSALRSSRGSDKRSTRFFSSITTALDPRSKIAAFSGGSCITALNRLPSAKV